MAILKSMSRFPYLFNTLTFLVLVIARPLSGAEPMPNSSRECAICHIRWVDTLVRDDSRKDIMDAVLDRQAGSGDMCLSCHDGSVVDSRFKVWSTRHHTTDSVPSPAVKIPTDKFPLDDKGRMTCATCHTAHAVPDSSDLKTVIFLRQPNVDSSLCLNCHPEHAQKNDFQHPLGHADDPVPQAILDAGGKTSEDGHMVFCQTCHEPHGARNAWMLVLPPAKLCIACHTDKSPETSPPAGAPVHRIGHTYTGFEPPSTLLDQRATFGPNGELDCLSCHRLHDASGAKPLLIRKNEDSSLCLECHKKEETVIGSHHDLRISSPETVNAKGEKPSESGPCGSCHRIHGWARDVPETNRPHSSGCMECHQTGGPGSFNRLYVDAHTVGATLSEGMITTLPLDSATGDIGCLTCHDPHNPSSSEITNEAAISQKETDSEVPAPRSFLRYEGSYLCAHCHETVGSSEYAPHEPMDFAPEVRRDLAIHSSIGPCRVCHTTHNANGPHLWSHTPATDSGNPTSDLCGACHEDKLGAQGSVHDPNTAEWAQKLGFASRGSCLDCHPVHGSGKQDSIWATLGYQEAPAQLCEACHRKNGPGKVMETAHIGRIVKNNIDTLPLSSDMRIMCTTCHDIHQNTQNPKLLRVPIIDLCRACHEDKLGVQNSSHDPQVSEWAQKLDFTSRGPCIDCHPIHGPAGQGSLWESIKSPDVSATLCETCHRLGAPGEAMETPHMEKILKKNFGSLPENLKVSDDGRILCTTCHDIHQNQRDRKLLRFPRQDSGLCLVCHSEFSGLLSTSHDLRLSAPDERNISDEIAAESGPCGSCHLVHHTARANGVWAKSSMSRSNFGRALCTCCHREGQCAEKHIPKHVDHPEVPLVNRTSPQQPSYMPTFDSDGEPSNTGTISCLTCHDPHANQSTTEANKEPSLSHHQVFLRPTEYQGFCTDCHGIEALWRFGYYHKDNRNPDTEQEVSPLTDSLN
jgi:predicted CXXCH cytochrome family protein